MPRTEVQVPVAGWQWLDDGESRVLVPVGATPYKGAPPVSVIDLSPALLRRFSQLKRSEASYLEFANQYGHLGIKRPVPMVDESGVSRWGIAWETLADWEERAIWARGVIDLWDRAAQVGSDGLSLFFWPAPLGNGTDVLYWQPPQQARHTARSFFPSFDLDQTEARRLYASKDFPALARQVVAYEIEVAMDGGARFEFATPTSFRFALEGLWNQMWFQFALETVGTRELRECPRCHDPFYLRLESRPDGSQRHRSTRRYCSDKCKDDYNNTQKAKRRTARRNLVEPQ